MQLTCHGAAQEVTGSCHHLRVKNKKGNAHLFLIDCGMFQGARYAEEANFEDFHFDPKTLEAVFITHAHADHTARLPKLIKDGFVGPIYCVHPTRPLTRIILEDSFHIMKENAEREGEPLLYDEADVETVFARMQTVNYHETMEIAPGITCMFHDAGHILGSAYLSIEAEGKRVVFSGDLGNSDVPILPETEELSCADVVICESTYGDSLHEDPKGRADILCKIMEQTVRDRSVLLIPSFSIERSQEVLYEIDQILLHRLQATVPIFLDSPMAIRATEIYRHYQNYLQFDADILAEPDRDFFAFPNLRETMTRDESKAINDLPAPKIIMAGSGMMSGGRIMHHLQRYLPNEKNQLFIIGYQSEGTLGRRLYEGAKQVRVYGQDVEVRASVKAAGTFSSHADQTKLTNWLTPKEGLIPQKIILVHGDAAVQEVFATHLRHHLRTEVVIPKKHQEIEI
jgi:metallo-beta-lactamase family protein